MNTELRKKQKILCNYFGKDFSKLMNNSDFGNIIEIVRKHQEIRFETTEKKNYLSSQFITQQTFSQKT